jgi:murein DD-endopeptidase MepM/ murein hydrolase activator NlpD
MTDVCFGALVASLAIAVGVRAAHARYGHLASASVAKDEEDKAVEAGDKIGVMGMTHVRRGWGGWRPGGQPESWRPARTA